MWSGVLVKVKTLGFQAHDLRVLTSMVRRELTDVGTGRRYIETVPDHSPRLRSVIRCERTARPARRTPPRRNESIRLGTMGLLLLGSGAVGLFWILYTQAEHLEALLVCITCLGAMMLGVCTLGNRSMEPPLRRS